MYFSAFFIATFYDFLISYDSCRSISFDFLADHYAWATCTVYCAGLGCFAFSAATAPGKLQEKTLAKNTVFASLVGIGGLLQRFSMGELPV
jgi:hypothetical protein